MRAFLRFFPLPALSLLFAFLAMPDVTQGAPLKDGRYTGTLRFIQSSPSGCPKEVCTPSISTDFNLKKSGKKFSFRQSALKATLSKGKNGVFSGYAGTARAGTCFLDIFPGVKAIPDKGMILASFVFSFRCDEGKLSALYVGRVRKR